MPIALRTANLYGVLVVVGAIGLKSCSQFKRTSSSREQIRSLKSCLLYFKWQEKHGDEPKPLSEQGNIVKIAKLINHRTIYH